MVRVAIVVSVLLAGLASSAAAPQSANPPAAEPAIDAFWVEHRVDFYYTGYTSQYNCDALRDKLVSLMRLAGARRDIEAIATGCVNPMSSISAFIHASLHFHSPVLKKPAEYVREPTAAPSHWTRVELRAGPRSLVEQGDCELLEQFRRQLLPYFEVRNIEHGMPCVPHQLPVRGELRLNFEALVGTHTAQEESIQQETQPPTHEEQMKSERK